MCEKDGKKKARPGSAILAVVRWFPFALSLISALSSQVFVGLLNGPGAIGNHLGMPAVKYDVGLVRLNPAHSHSCS
jgi:hypothetical protein